MPFVTTRSPNDSPILQLSAALSPDRESAAVVKLEWRPTEELNDLVHGFQVEQRFKNPKLLVIVSNLGSQKRWDGKQIPTHDVTRTYLFPLDWGAHYIEFNRAGINNVRAYVVDVSTEKQQVVAGLLVRHGADLDESGNLSYSDLPTIETGALFTVVVPAEMFAKEPSQWLQKFVGCFYETKPRNQCKFEWRVIISVLLIAPGLLTFGMLFRLGTLLVALALGLRRIRWSGLLPFNIHVLPWPSGRKHSFYTHTKDGYERSMGFLFAVVNPTTLTIPALLFYGVWQLASHGHANFWGTFLFVDGGIAAVGVFMIVVVLIGGLVSHGWAATVNSPARRARLDTERRQREDDERQAYLQRLSRLTQTPMRLHDPTAAPAENLTARLLIRVEAFKSTHCKPFQR